MLFSTPVGGELVTGTIRLDKALQVRFVMPALVPPFAARWIGRFDRAILTGGICLASLVQHPEDALCTRVADATIIAASAFRLFHPPDLPPLVLVFSFKHSTESRRHCQPPCVFFKSFLRFIIRLGFVASSVTKFRFPNPGF
jgi:hypothetical protein